jgi:hypothetical protein
MKTKKTKRPTAKKASSTPEPAGKPGCYPGLWTGKAIWDGGEAAPRHRFLFFRKTFDVPADARDARLRITAQDKYLVYVNGRYLGRGPARSAAPDWAHYDQYDLSEVLTPGRNTVAVQAYFYGELNNYSGFSRNKRAGFWAQLEWTDGQGRRAVVGSDDSWKVRPAEGYRRDVNLTTSMLGTLTEVYDAGLDPADWHQPEFDDTGWVAATSVTPSWSQLEPSPTTPLRERPLAARAIAALGETRELTNTHAFTIVGDTQVAERLAAERHFPLEHARIENAEALLAGGTGGARFQSAVQEALYTLTTGPGTRDPFVILDFGEAIFGFPRLEFTAPERTVVEVAWTAQLVDGRAPCLEGAGRYGNAYIAREGRQTWQPFEPRLFRYIQVVFRNAANQLALKRDDESGFLKLRERNARPVTVHALDAVRYEPDVEVKGAFTCSDDTLTRIWTAGVNSVRLHMEDTFVMDAQRERALYVLAGEMEQSHQIIQAGFGPLPFTEHHFRQTTRQQTRDGLIPLWMRSDGHNPGINGYLTHYARAVRNRFWFTGRVAFLEEHYPALVKLAGWFTDKAGPDGLLYNLPGWSWMDWVKTDFQGANFEYNAVYCEMLDHLAEIAGHLENPRDARKWRAMAEAVRRTLRATHWNEAAGLFADSVDGGKQSATFTELANALALRNGIASPEQAAIIRARLTDDSGGETVGYSRQGLNSHFERQDPAGRSALVCASPLYFAYVLEGLAAGGAADHAIGYLNRRYNVMMSEAELKLHELWPQLDAYQPGVRWWSLYHTGGGGAVWFLVTRVLGIEPAAPGYAACRIAPCCGNLAWAKGTLPTVRGPIHVAWEKRDGAFALTVNLPHDMPTTLELPVEDGRGVAASLDGKAVPVTPTNAGLPGQTGRHAILRVDGGEHTIRMRKK